MSQFLVTVSQGEEAFVRKLLGKLPGVRVEKMKAPAKLTQKPLTAQQQEWVDDLKQSLLEAEASARGEITLPTLDEHLAELRGHRKQAA